MLKDYVSILVSRSDIYKKILAQKAIFTLNYFVVPESQYTLSEVKELIAKYSSDPIVLLNMMDLKQAFKYSVEENGYHKLTRTAIEYLITLDISSQNVSPNTQLKHIVSLSQLGEDGKKVLYDKLNVYLTKQKLLPESDAEYNLVLAIAEKAKKTLDHLSKEEEYTVDEIAELIVKYLSDEKDLYRLLNLHEFYGVDNIQNNRNCLSKDAIFCLIKEHLSFEKAMEFSAYNAGRTQQKELERVVTNLKLKEDNKNDIVKSIDDSPEIKDLKSVLVIYKDKELLELLVKYNLLAYAERKFPDYFEKIVDNKEEVLINKVQLTLRRLFAEVLVNKVYEIEDLAYFILGSRDEDSFLRYISVCEGLSQLYAIKFEEFMKIKDNQMSSGQAIVDFMREAIFNKAYNSDKIEDANLSKDLSATLGKIIRDIKWHLFRDNIDFNIKSKSEILDYISIAMDKHGADIYLLEKYIGSEIRKDKDEIFDIIVENEFLSEKYEKLERLHKNEKLTEDVRKKNIEDLELMLIDDGYLPEQLDIIKKELNVKLIIQQEQEQIQQKKEQKQDTGLKKEFEKNKDIFDKKSRDKIAQLIAAQKIEEIGIVIKAQSLAVKTRLYLSFDSGSKFLKLLDIEKVIFAELKSNYTPADGQFTGGYMEKIKNLWDLSTKEVRRLGDIIGNNGRKARK